mmetsp:Transcript_10525/g.21193  ORF Transcript_10525/g.21193 Transcript_10525/m.21193 type:complete len:972 (-) Transcript_10525:610-3525(-)
MEDVSADQLDDGMEMDVHAIESVMEDDHPTTIGAFRGEGLGGALTLDPKNYDAMVVDGAGNGEEESSVAEHSVETKYPGEFTSMTAEPSELEAIDGDECDDANPAIRAPTEGNDQVDYDGDLSFHTNNLCGGILTPMPPDGSSGHVNDSSRHSLVNSDPGTTQHVTGAGERLTSYNEDGDTSHVVSQGDFKVDQNAAVELEPASGPTDEGNGISKISQEVMVDIGQRFDLVASREGEDGDEVGSNMKGEPAVQGMGIDQDGSTEQQDLNNLTEKRVDDSISGRPENDEGQDTVVVSLEAERYTDTTEKAAAVIEEPVTTKKDDEEIAQSGQDMSLTGSMTKDEEHYDKARGQMDAGEKIETFLNEMESGRNGTLADDVGMESDEQEDTCDTGAPLLDGNAHSSAMDVDQDVENTSEMMNDLEAECETKDSPDKEDVARAEEARREQERKRYELPDNVEEILARKIQRTPLPSKEDLDQSIAVQRALVDAAFAQLNSGKELRIRRSQTAETAKAESAPAKKAYDEARAALFLKFDEKKQLNEKIDEMRLAVSEGSGKASSSGDNAPNALLKKIKTVEELDKKVQELELRFRSETLSLQEEKKLVADIAFLRHKGKDFILEGEKKKLQEKQQHEDRKSQVEALEQQRKRLDEEINIIKKDCDTKKRAFEQIRARQNKVFEDISKEIGQVDQEALRKQIMEAKNEITRITEGHKKKLSEHYENERLWNQQEMLRKRMKAKKRFEEFEARRAEREKELAEYGPPDHYIVEKGMCDSLSAFLKALQGSTKVEADIEGSPNPSTSPAVPGKTIGKTSAQNSAEDESYSAFGKGKKGPKRRTRRESTTTEKSPLAKITTLSIDRFTAFQKLGVTPPSTYGDIAGALEAIQKRREYFEKAPPPKEESTSSSGKKNSSSTSRPNGTFSPDLDTSPSLVEGVPVPTHPAKFGGPSYKDIMRGSVNPGLPSDPMTADGPMDD